MINTCGFDFLNLLLALSTCLSIFNVLMCLYVVWHSKIVESPPFPQISIKLQLK